jgi:hypothetical protein
VHTMVRQSLYLSLRTGFRNPSKHDLITMINIVSRSQPQSLVSVHYMIVDNIKPIYTNKLYGKVENMKLLNHLSSTDYTDREINIPNLLNELNLR